MKSIKFPLIVLFSLLFLCFFLPPLSAKHHHSHKYRYKSKSTGFAVNLHLNPSYAAYGYAPRVAIRERVAVVPSYPMVEQRLYYPYPYRTVIAPYYSQPAYVYPSYPYWGY